MHKFVNTNDNIISHVGFKELKGCLKDTVYTLLDMLISRVETNGDDPIIGTIVNENQMSYCSYKDMNLQAKRLGRFLETVTQEREIVGIASVNRREWLVAEYATYYANCINSPVYVTFTPQNQASAIMKTNMHTIIASAVAAETILSHVIKLHGGKSSLERIILMDDDQKVFQKCKDAGFKVFFLSEIINDEKLGDPTRKHPKKDDLATVCFTSGTGGEPKGVELTHGNFISQVEGFVLGSEKYDVVKIKEDDCYMSYLPMAHVLERVCVCICIWSGARIGIHRGTREKLRDDYKIIRPTFVPVVPKVLQVFHDTIESKVMEKNFLSRGIFRLGMAYKIFMQRFGVYESPVWDKLLFGKIAALFGGRIRACLCGGAGINPEIIRYMQAILSAKIFQGYGQTEGIGANILSTFTSTDVSSVGIPFLTTELRLESVKDYPSDHKLLYMRGPAITRGYYKDDKATESAFPLGDGWLNTGDIVTFKDGQLYIVGRHKDVIKIGNGEYVSPESIELLLADKNIENVSDIYITAPHGNMNLAVLVVCKKEDIDVESIAERIQKAAKELIKEGKLDHFVRFQHFAVINRDFTEFDTQNGGSHSLFTPSLKKRRHAFDKCFEKEIKQAYDRTIK